MLQSLSIKNIATIKALEVNFSGGFNVLLGETGAGKSIIFDSLSFVLGGKADKTLIRTGEDFMRVDAVFTNLNKNAQVYLAELGYDEADEILISRTYQADGKNNCKINGQTSSPAVLKQLAFVLVDVYGQHEGQALLNAKNHLAVLDSYDKEKLLPLKDSVLKRHAAYREVISKLNSLGGSREEKDRQIDMLSFQVTDIENAKIKEGELAELSEKLSSAANAEKILTAIGSVREALSADFLSSAISELSGVSSYSDQLADFAERLKASLIELEDVEAGLADFEGDISFDEKTLNKMDARADEIKRVIRKYGGTEKATLEFFEKTSERLEELRHSDELMGKLEKELEEKKTEYLAEAKKLSAVRKQNAQLIEEKALTSLADLGMKNSRFKIQFKEGEPSSNGIDEVEFFFSANMGEELKSLARTISGGEMSRFMLALKNILAEKDGVATLVFDEIDAGISGDIGLKVAEKLCGIGKSYQVLCITHLSQVAAAADNFIFISKNVVDGKTESTASPLVGKGILTQIAKLSGGEGGSERALAHAEELRERMIFFKNQK